MKWFSEQTDQDVHDYDIALFKKNNPQFRDRIAIKKEGDLVTFLDKNIGNKITVNIKSEYCRCGSCQKIDNIPNSKWYWKGKEVSEDEGNTLTIQSNPNPTSFGGQVKIKSPEDRISEKLDTIIELLRAAK